MTERNRTAPPPARHANRWDLDPRIVPSLRFGPGDELLATDHGYNARRNVVDFVGGRTGAQFGIEVPVYHWPGPPRKLLRISAQAYNRPAQYEQLAAALEELL